MTEYIVLCTWEHRQKAIGPFPDFRSAEKWYRDHRWPPYVPSQDGVEHREIQKYDSAG